MRVAVTGANGRLGRALVAALEDAPFTGPFGPIAWTRREWDLDDPGTIALRLREDRPETVVHAAAWTDVDGCARDPELATARNAVATDALARACAAAGADLLVVSTNEVFDGERTLDEPYGPDDEPRPINPYGASKLHGERRAAAAYAGAAGAIGIVRTSWLFGPPGDDFPAKILAAAERATIAGEPVRLVADEIGSPTYTHDLADAIVELVGEGAVGGTHHVVNAGAASRAEWGREVLRGASALRPGSPFEVATEDVPAATWPRASTPPAWAVLEPTPLPGGEPLRAWQAATADYLPALLRQRDVAAATSVGAGPKP